MSKSAKQRGGRSAAAIPVGSDYPTMQNVAFTNLNADSPHVQPRCKEIGCGANLIRLPQCAFPHRRDSPSVFEEFCANGAVASEVRVELRSPELRSGRRHGRVAAALVSMPKAAVHEDHGAVLRKDKVRPTVNLAGMKPEAETARVQCPPKSQLGLRVLAPYSRHHPGTGLLIHDIGHMCPGFRHWT